MEGGEGGRGTPYDGLYWEAPPERGIFFRLQAYQSVGISLVEVYKRGSQWGGGFYGYRLKFGLFYGYRLIFFSYG